MSFSSQLASHVWNFFLSFSSDMFCVLLKLCVELGMFCSFCIFPIYRGWVLDKARNFLVFSMSTVILLIPKNINSWDRQFRL